jgi:HK97 family phage major capsid protein
MATRLELQTKRNALVAQGRTIYELAAKEKREMTAAEIADFDKFMNESDAVKKELDGVTSGKSAERGKRLADASRELRASEGRRVGNERIGTEESREISSPGDAALTYRDEKGEEFRGLRLHESISLGMRETLPDGIQASELSLGRLVKACITGNWRGAEAEKRSLGGSSDVLGGVIVPFPLAADVIDLARNNSVCFKAGAITLPMNSSTLKIGKLLSDPQIGWKAENSPGAFSDATFGSVTLSARTLMALCSASVELIEDASNLDQLLQSSLAKVLALELDRACLRGDQTASMPLGVRNNPGIQYFSVGTNGLIMGNTIFPAISNGVLAILNKNIQAQTVIMAPRSWAEIDQLVDTLGRPLEAPDSYQALQKLVTNQIPINLVHGSANTASEIYVGDWTKMIVGMRTELKIEVTRAGGGSTGSAFQNLQTWVRAYLRADVVLSHQEAFYVIDGVL